MPARVSDWRVYELLVSVARLGYRVALIDADIGLRNLDLLLGLENRVMYTAMEVLDGDCRLEQALIRDKRWRNLALLVRFATRQPGCLLCVLTPSRLARLLLRQSARTGSGITSRRATWRR